MACLKYLVGILAFFLCFVPVVAQFSFDAAAQAYANGDYNAAVSVYETAIAAGVRDGGVFFNLATAYLAAGDDAQALLNYLRAAEYLPRDGDTQLQIARLRASREDGMLQETNVILLVGTITQSWLTYSELNGLTWCVWTSFFILLAIFLRQKNWRQRLRPLLGLWASGVCLCLALLWSRWWVQTAMPAAIIMPPAAQVLNGAGENYLPLFRVLAAAEVRILETRADWVRISLPDGRQGWVHEDDVKRVMLP